MKGINEKYTDPSAPGSFSAISGFIKNNKTLNKENVMNHLGTLDAVTLHVPKKLKFRRVKVEVAGIDSQWQ